MLTPAFEVATRADSWLTDDAEPLSVAAAVADDATSALQPATAQADEAQNLSDGSFLWHEVCVATIFTALYDT